MAKRKKDDIPVDIETTTPPIIAPPVHAWPLGWAGYSTSFPCGQKAHTDTPWNTVPLTPEELAALPPPMEGFEQQKEKLVGKLHVSDTATRDAITCVGCRARVDAMLKEGKLEQQQLQLRGTPSVPVIEGKFLVRIGYVMTSASQLKKEE